MINRLSLLRRALSETQRAQAAQIPKEGEETIFDKIIRREIPSAVVYEDDQVLAFRDVSPQAPTHILLIPKVRGHLTGLGMAREGDKALLGHLMWAAAQIANQQNLNDGWRLVVNSGRDGGQSVYHLHLHILGGKQLTWPPG